MRSTSATSIRPRTQHLAAFPMRPTRASIACRAILEKRIIHIRDTMPDRELLPVVQDLTIRSILALPLLREDTVIGSIALNAMEPGGFSDSQVALLQTFAEQAVIAIGSAATYRELQARTAALAERNSEYGERIEHQSATIDVLKAMSASPDDHPTGVRSDCPPRAATVQRRLCRVVRIRWQAGLCTCVVGRKSGCDRGLPGDVSHGADPWVSGVQGHFGQTDRAYPGHERRTGITARRAKSRCEINSVAASAARRQSHWRNVAQLERRRWLLR